MSELATGKAVPLGELLAARRGDVVPRLALMPDEAAAAIGVGRTFFDEQVLPQIKIVRRGKKRIIPVDELTRWLERNASRVLEG